VVADDMVDGSSKLFEYSVGLQEFILVMFFTSFDQVTELQQKINTVIGAVFEA